MNPTDAEEYTQALGQVVAGGWRQVALGERLGVPAALGLSTEAWVEERLGGYVRLSIPDRREAVAELTEQGMTTREIGDVLGVNQSTVVRDRDAGASAEPGEAPGQTRFEDFVDADASAQEMPGAPPLPMPDPELPTPDELAADDVRMRRSTARKMLTAAERATSALSPSVDSIAEAVLAQGVDELAAERDRIDRNRQVWDRLLRAIDQQANPKLRRVK